MKSSRKVSYILILVLLVISMFASTGIVSAATEWYVVYTVKYADGHVDSGTSDKKDDVTTSYATFHLSCSENLLVNPGQSTSGIPIVSYSIKIWKNTTDTSAPTFDSCGGTRPDPTPTPTQPPPTPTPPTPTPTETPGCTDPTALNYNPNATVDDGSCDKIGGILIPVTGADNSGLSFTWLTALISLVLLGSIKVSKKIRSK